MKRRELIEQRYRQNCEAAAPCDDYIFSQNSSRVRDLRYGDRHVGYNGCGAVALYNVMRFIGKPQDFCELLRDMENLHMPWLNGAFGTKPWSLGRYFRKRNISYRKMSFPNDFKAALLTDAVGIVCTWNERFRGMHFYCVCYDPKDRAYYTANFFSNGEKFRQIQPEEISNFRFVVGYTVPRAAWRPENREQRTATVNDSGKA